MTDLTTFRAADAVWHAHERGADVALCGEVVPPFKAGRRRPPTCSGCLAAACALPVEATPEFWGWRPEEPKPEPVAARVPDAPVTPAQRPDGRCVVCSKVRRRPAKSHRAALAAWERDPFCSTECAKQFFGVTSRRDDGWQSETARREFDADVDFLQEDAA